MNRFPFKVSKTALNAGKTKKTSILMIDDDEMIAEALRDYLNRFDFDLQTCHHPEEGMEVLKQGKHKLLLLDVMLPGINGMQVCQQIRKSTSDPVINDIPIIMLTARGELNDMVLGFEHGADDYLAKPFEPRELIARMQRLLQRHEKNMPKKSQPAPSPPLKGFKIDKEKRQVVINDKAIDLTSIEFDILSLLSGNPGVVYDRNKILQHVKGLNEGVMLQTRAIDNSISRLRRKISDVGDDQQLIRTVWGQGYSFTGLSA